MEEVISSDSVFASALRARTDNLAWLESRGLAEHIGVPVAGAPLYVGIDPTHPSLHLGHLVLLNYVRGLQVASGCAITVVLGIVTAQVGDPTGKDQERASLSASVVRTNADRIRSQVQALYPSFSIRENSEWLDMSLGSFLRWTSRFSVNRPLKADFFSRRLSSGRRLGLNELLYPTLQAYDHYHLWSTGVARGQAAGSDQRSNIIGCVHLSEELFGVTFPLATDRTGAKLSKTGRDTPYVDEDYCDELTFWRACVASDALVSQSEFFCASATEWLGNLMRALGYREFINFSNDMVSHRSAPDLLWFLQSYGGCASRSTARDVLKNSDVRVDGQALKHNVTLRPGNRVQHKGRTFLVFGK